jgi:hypothetical protein
MTERAVFGPFVPGVVDVERIAELRSLAALVAVFTGSANPLVAVLRQAETDPEAAAQAQELLDRVPSLTRRRLLSTFGSVTWPAKPRGRS